jgi:hypothetical protein
VQLRQQNGDVRYGTTDAFEETEIECSEVL